MKQGAIVKTFTLFLSVCNIKCDLLMLYALNRYSCVCELHKKDGCLYVHDAHALL